MKVINGIYDAASEEGRIETTPEFNRLPQIVKMDILQDLINELEDLYNAELSGGKYEIS